MEQDAQFKNRFAAALSTLEALGQEHVLHFYAGLDAASKEKLLDQIESVDWEELSGLIESHVKVKPEVHLSEDIEPAPWYPSVPAEGDEKKYEKALALGHKLIKDGRVAAFTVAGGQGTRLGWAGPKGTFAATPLRGVTLFGCFAEYIRHVQKKYDCTVPWYIMTSPLNHTETVKFFEENEYLGLDKANVMLFPQGMMPAVDCESGKVLLQEVDSIALSPNGHGGSLKALYTSRAIHDMRQRGIQHISYVQVDNPLVKLIDPMFIGLHAMDESEMSSKMLPKRDPFEKLGNFCKVDDKVTVIEYSDLPDELAVQRGDDGELKFLAGSVAIHAMTVDFVEKLNKGGFGLPFHRADKKVPYLDFETKLPVNPEEPNGVKLETFVFDALPLCEVSIVYEALREEEFAPIKNADGPGVLDSPATSKQMQSDRAGRWLEANGVDVPRDAHGHVDAMIEISQVTAVDAEGLAKHPLPEKIDRGAEILL
ncbi:UTP--glucose-1-phosphate uridylyltransferase [Poriferisphaera sp. WC338]|uniref:UTP--glucose-1-phosphate uridylyltransferase n=1 Tax=Poriferisphaera sp. WC338 TaxID=3425129 RepID=UPI003D817658